MSAKVRELEPTSCLHCTAVRASSPTTLAFSVFNLTSGMLDSGFRVWALMGLNGSSRSFVATGKVNLDADMHGTTTHRCPDQSALVLEGLGAS